jgi:hypothetical protein
MKPEGSRSVPRYPGQGVATPRVGRIAGIPRLRSRDLFPAEEPIRPPQRLIGRRRDVAQLSAQIAEGLHAIVVAPRRAGTTTLCEAAIAALPRLRFQTVGVSLFRHTNATALAEALAQEALATDPALRQAVAQVRGLPASAARVPSAAKLSRLESELGEGVRIALEPTRRRRDPLRELSLALELPQRIAEREERQLVLFVDEVQRLGSGAYGEPMRLTGRLWEALDRSPRVSCLLAGSAEHRIRELLGTEPRALELRGAFHQLSPIGAEEWRGGLRERLDADECTIDPEALELIVASGECHPRSTMLIAQQAHQGSVEEATRHLDAALAERGYREALAVDAGRHAELIDRIRAIGAAATEIVLALASQRPPTAGLEKSAAERALGALADTSIVIRPAAEEDWALADPLFAAYVRREIHAD